MLVAIYLAGVIAGSPPPVRGDFDHDGKADVAEVVPAPHGRYRLVIRGGAAGHRLTVIATYDAREVPNLYIDLAKPGRWKTWCGKGGGPVDAPCPRRYVILRGDTLSFGMKEASESVAVWTGRRYRVVLLSD